MTPQQHCDHEPICHLIWQEMMRGWTNCERTCSYDTRSRPAPSPDCTWKLDDEYGMYETGCGNAFECIEGDIEENNFKFCPYCGGRIKEIVEGAP